MTLAHVSEIVSDIKAVGSDSECTVAGEMRIAIIELQSKTPVCYLIKRLCCEVRYLN